MSIFVFIPSTLLPPLSFSLLCSHFFIFFTMAVILVCAHKELNDMKCDYGVDVLLCWHFAMTYVLILLTKKTKTQLWVGLSKTTRAWKNSGTISVNILSPLIILECFNSWIESGKKEKHYYAKLLSWTCERVIYILDSNLTV